MDEDAIIEKKIKEDKEAATQDGTEVIVKKKQKYQSRKPFLFTVYVLFHYALQGLILGSEATSDTSGITQIVHYFCLEICFCISLIFVWPHNVPSGNWIHTISLVLFNIAIGLALFIHPVIRSSMASSMVLNENVVEQLMILFFTLSIIPLLTIEMVGTFIQLRLFILFIIKYYVIDFVYSIGKQIYLCFRYCKSEVKKARRRRKAKMKKGQIVRGKRPSSRASMDSSISSLEGGSDRGADINAILETKKEHVKIDLAQQQMNRYVNAGSDGDDAKPTTKELLGFTFTEEEIANWKPEINKNNGEDSEDSEEEEKEDQELHFNQMTYEQREAKANKIEMELAELNTTLKQMGVNQGHKKEEVVEAHRQISKKQINKKWVRTKLRATYGNQILQSAGANKRVLEKDRTEALWAINKKRREKERRAKEWAKYSTSQSSGKNINVGSLGLEHNDSGHRGR